MTQEFFIYTLIAISLGSFILIIALLVLLYPLRSTSLSSLLEMQLKAFSHRNDRLEWMIREEGSRRSEETSYQGTILREELANRVRDFQDSILRIITNSQSLHKSQLEIYNNQLKESFSSFEWHLDKLMKQIEQTHNDLRKSIEDRLDAIRFENVQQLEQVRSVVEEKLHGALERRLGESFRIVSERLEQVHRGLGEMQALASGVGDLKKVLTNVKTRGIWGEIQLGVLLNQILAPDQIAQDVVTCPSASERVEFAIRLPGASNNNGSEVLLPIDSKFPQEDYDRLLQATDKADSEGIEGAGKQLETRIKSSARDIRDKYIHPPYTTDFALLFLPVEGLYAEVLRRPGLADQLQRDYRVVIAGPTTLSALLNALQIGFRTLNIEKRSSEVWHILGAVRTEFSRYGSVLEKVQKKLQEASNTLDDIARRKRIIDRQLRDVETLSSQQSENVLGLSTSTILAEE